MLRWVHGEHNRRDEAGQLLIGETEYLRIDDLSGKPEHLYIDDGDAELGRGGRRRRVAREGHGMRIVD